MKTLFSCFARRTAVLFLTLGLPGYQLSHAQARPQVPAPAAAGLRVIVTPLANGAVLRVRYESAAYGSVRLQLRDTQGRVLYADVLRQARFAGDFDLAAFPAGTYTLELQTPGSRYVETVELRKSSPLVALLVGHAGAQAAAVL